MSDEKNRFGDTMRVVERAKEDIYFAESGSETGTSIAPCNGEN
jgi:hypothetical protein